MDVPNIPVAPVAPLAPAVNTAPAAKAPEVKVGAPADAKAADAIKTTTAAEKAVIQKIKVGDQEFDETTLKSMIEKAKGADKKFLEAAQARKEAMRFFKMAKENPREFLEKTGHDPRKFSYDEVAKDIQDKLRDPREVELEKAQARLKEFEAKEAAEKERIQQEKLSHQAKALEQRMHAQAIAALEAHPAIPKNGFSVARMAKYLEVVQQKTGELLSFEDVAGVIEADIRSEAKGLFDGANADQIIELLGEKGVEAIRQHFLSKLKDPLKGGTGATTNEATKAKPKFKDSKDFWKTIDKAAKAERGQ
jgi:hypothetical protein